MNIDFEKIKSFPPDRRIKALNEAKQTLNSEIEDSKKKMQEINRLLQLAESEESLIEEIIVPETKKMNIKDIFEKTKIKLEDKIKNLPEEERNDIEELAKKPIEQLYTQIKTFNETITKYQNEEEKYVSFNEEKRREIYLLALQEKRRAQETGEYRTTDKKDYLMTIAEKMLYKNN